MRIRYLLLLVTLLWSSLAMQAQRTCATHDILEQQLQDPKNATQHQLIEQQIQDFIDNYQPNPLERAVITLPIIFHVIHDGDAVGSGENISDAQVMAQLNQLNADFSATNSDIGSVPAAFSGVVADAEIQFCLAQTDPDGNPTTGIERYNYSGTSTNGFTTNQIDGTIKPQTIWDRDCYLNFWVVRFGGGDSNLLGYAQFPNTGQANTDGVVHGFGTIGSLTQPGSSAPYDRGRTATHEIGHWLGLYHIWGDINGGGCGGDDNIADTPIQSASNGGCPTHPSATCGNGGDMFMNYMDYVNDVCMYMFSEGQKTRMQAVLNGFRSGVRASCACTVVEDFAIAATPADVSVCSPDDATYTVDVTPSGGFTGNVALTVTGGLPAGATATFAPTTVTGGTGSSTLTITSAGVAPGTYTITVQGAGTPGNQTTTVDFTVLSGAAGAVTLVNPANTATGVSTSAPLSWNAATDAVTYRVEVATDAGFTSIVFNQNGITGTSVIASGLSINTTYYWRVRAINPCGNSAWSTVWEFTTQDVTPCAEYTTGPFIDFNPLPSACFNNCTPVTQTFEVYQNESYVFYNMAGGEEYTFDFCNGYSAGTWEALITVAEFDAAAGAVVANSEFATTAGCTITFTIPSNGDYVLVIADANNCGGATVETDNGIPTLTCSGLTSCCDATFTDPGGASTNYPNDGNATYTMCPDFPGQMIQVDFTAFSLEDGGGSNCWDYITIYDGNSTGAPQIGGRNCDTPSGPGSPGTVTSTSADGCLTFQFISDGSVQQAGWVADVTCIGGPITLSPKVFLQGPFSGSSMVSGVGSGGMIPTTSPYADAKTATAGVLSGMVDWVYVEIRDAATGATVLEGQSALLMPDGTVVDTDGTSPLTLGQAAGNYHVAIRHRNHLGVMTATPITVN